MHLITTTGQQATMSSREIADLVGIRHDNVKRTIDTLAQKGVIAFPQTEEKATAGRPAVEYIFAGENGKRDSIVVVAQLFMDFPFHRRTDGRVLDLDLRDRRCRATLRLVTHLAGQLERFGLVEHKSNIVIDGSGVERIRDQVRVTAKGIARLAAIIEKEAA